MSGAWKSISVDQLEKYFVDGMSFAIMRGQVECGEIRLEDTPKEFQKTLREDERQAHSKWEREKLVRETPMAPCPFCGGPAEAWAESGPMEMGGSSTEHHVGCRSCGAGVRTEDPLRSRQGWNRRVER